MIMEKEHAYEDAQQHYEQAWKVQKESSTSVGYKLAFNLLKSKRYLKAIKVCHKVLALNPDYPRIKNDVLFKCRNHLRV